MAGLVEGFSLDGDASLIRLAALQAAKSVKGRLALAYQPVRKEFRVGGFLSAGAGNRTENFCM